jgi:dihydroxyacetone kinase-like predicted kinase
VIDGGQTMNPSTGDFLEAIDALPNTEIVLLPNNKNIMLSARQAAERATGKQVRVVPSMTLPQGIAALVEYANLCIYPDCPLDNVVDGMSSALGTVTTCEITTATRSVDLDGVSVSKGEYIGLLNDALVVAGSDVPTVAQALLERANAGNYERITVYYGIDIHERQARELVASLKTRYTRQEFELIDGGQALYPYIISLE